MDVEPLSVSISEDVTLNVRRWAGPGFRAFLLVHGLSSNAKLWDGVAEALAGAGHPVYAVDLRGHGESSSPPTGYDTATAAADLAALIAALGLRSPVVAGQSWGGNVVVRLAAEHPELVGAVALLDGGWFDPPGWFGSWEACEAALRPAELGDLHVDKLRQLIRAGHPGWSAAAIEATVANLRVGPDGKVSRRLPVDRHLSILRSMYDDLPRAYFPKVTMPALLMPALPSTDTESGRWNRKLVAEAAAAMRQARIVEYVGADHDLHAQYPERVAADLLFLAGEAPPS